MTGTVERVAGVFEYIKKMNGWDDSFRVVDTDGMTFVLDHLKRFSGKEVVITIEERDLIKGDDPE